MISKNDINDVMGMELCSTDGDKIGGIGQVFLDDQTGEPEWVTVKTGLFGSNESFVPIRDASVENGAVVVPWDKATIKDAPNVDPDGGHLDESEEARLYDYYGLDYSTSQSDSGLPTGFAGTESGTTGNTSAYDEGRDTSGPNTDEAMTRSEEQLRVGTEKQEVGRARLRKYVETEQEQVSVPVTKEKVRLETEPITGANRDAALGGPDISEEEHEVTLTEERPVVTKEAVPVERVRLTKETETEQENVSTDLRKERIDADVPDGR
ncbi:MAG: hypothetical protein QOJ90_2883 [Actinomycetota bacterium]|nr:hypothetical protein [Actinomycetota bacterium]